MVLLYYLVEFFDFRLRAIFQPDPVVVALVVKLSFQVDPCGVGDALFFDFGPFFILFGRRLIQFSRCGLYSDPVSEARLRPLVWQDPVVVGVAPNFFCFQADAEGNIFISEVARWGHV